MSERMYPIQDGPSVPWSVMSPHEAQSQRNHGQSINRIAERGGFGCSEAWCVVNGIHWTDMEQSIGHTEAKKRWIDFAEKINNHYAKIEGIKADHDRLHRIITHIAEHGIHTDRVDAHITMSMADQKEDLVTVLEREIDLSKPQNV